MADVEARKVQLDRLASLFQNSDYSDLVIRCGGHDFKVYKAIVCSQCHSFNAALQDGFKESETGIIKIEEEDPAVVQAMLEFFYTCDFSCPLQKSPTLFCVQVHTLAEEREISQLKRLAETKFKAYGEKHWETANFLRSVQAIYTSTVASERGLRDIAARIAYNHADAIFTTTEKCRIVLDEVPDFAADLFMLSRGMKLTT